MEVVVSACTRSLDNPKVPLLVSSIKFVINMLLDFMFISKYHLFGNKPTVVAQALIRMSCDLTSALCGLVYFFYISTKPQKECNESNEQVRSKWECFKVLARPAFYTVFESAIRNGIYLWLIANIVSMGSDYATSWGIFNTVRWGTIMVPVQALEASALTFVGHQWGSFRARVGAEVEKPKATNKDLLMIARPALMSTGIALITELVLLIVMSFWGVHGFAYYLSNSEEVASLTSKMWKTIDWCYIFYALSYELATLLLASIPKWCLFHAALSNFLWMLPWAIFMTCKHVEEKNAWSYHSVIFGGALVFDSITVLVACIIWMLLLRKGRIALAPVTRDT